MTDPLRILIVVSFANLAGAQIAAVRLARGLRDRGHDPKVIFLYEQRPVDGADHPYEVVVPKAKPGAAGYLRMGFDLAKIIKREQPDVVLTFLPLANVLGQAVARLSGIRCRIVSHRMPVNTASPLLRRMDLAWAFLGLYTGVVAVSESVKLTCRKYPEWLLKKTVVVHNGLRDFHPSKLTHEEARRRFDVPEGKTALVAVGRFAKQKNYPFLLSLMPRLDNVLLLIAGDGPLRPELEQQIRDLGIEDKVRLLGAVHRDDVPDLLAAADIFVQTSLYEGQSNSVLEALQAGVPIVAHDIAEQRETIEGENGMLAGALVPLNDVNAWVKAIEGLRASPEAVTGAHENALRQAAMFTYDRMISGFEHVLRTAVAPVREEISPESKPA